ncbi:MAG: epimerase [Mesorhizobium amorphae]|nr:MAG: epimerase [Mesorhizobium amorphae]
MRVIVTGSSGFLGRNVAAHLAAAGHSVLGVDTAPAPDRAGWDHVTADLAEFAPALELVRNVDAVVHVAAIPRPTGRTAGTVFHTNVAACFNVVEAARLARIPRLVYASSFSVLGYPFGEPFVAPRSLPITEELPTHAQDAYGLSKWLGEEIVEAAVRGGAMSAVSLRMPWVQSPETFASQIGPRRATADSVRDLWSYIDVRDAAEAFRLALEWQGSGHLRAYVAASDTYLEHETAPALERALPGVPRTSPLDGHAGLIDTSRARAALGFVARHSWRDYSQEEM